MKKILSLILITAMLMSTLMMFSPASSAAVVYAKGDINKDGIVSVKDSLVMKQYLIGMNTSKIDNDSDALLAGDVDKDNIITVKDRLYLIKYLVCVISSFDNLEPVTRTLMIGDTAFTADNYVILMPTRFVTNGNTSLDPGDIQNSFHMGVRKFKGYLGYVGPDLSIMTQEDYDANPAKPHYIKFTTAPDDSYGNEGFNISTSDSNVTITVSNCTDTVGATPAAGQVRLEMLRGALYGAYSFLEDYLGCKFYWDYGPALTKTGLVRVPNGVDDTQTPGFGARGVVGYTSSHSPNGYDNYDSTCYTIPRKMNDYWCNGSLHNVAYGYTVGTGRYHAHSMGAYCGTESGHQPCMSSTSTVESCKAAIYHEIFEEDIKNAKRIPGVSMTEVSCSMSDNVNFCTCVNCKAKYAQYGCFNGAYFEVLNQVAEYLETIQPELDIYAILYDHVIPNGIIPRSNITLAYCGQGCNNHTINGGECTTPGEIKNFYSNSYTLSDGKHPNDYGSVNDGVNTYDAQRLMQFGQLARDNGFTVQYWYYPTNVSFYICPTPNYNEIYYDLKYIYECGIQGVYFEGPSSDYAFEDLKNYLACEMLWNPEMTFGEYQELIDDYLMVHCGDGWRYIKEFIALDEAAGDAMTCWVNNFEWPWEMMSRKFYREHYDEMSDLFDKALACTSDTKQISYINKVRVHCDFLGISASFGTRSDSAFVSRYNNMLTYIRDNGIELVGNGLTYTIPGSGAEMTDPMTWIDAFSDGVYYRRPANAT